MIRTLDIERLRREFNEAQSFRFVKIDGFLDEAFADELTASYPTVEEAEETGFEFRTVNERLKVQSTDSSRFRARTRSRRASCSCLPRR